MLLKQFLDIALSNQQTLITVAVISASAASLTPIVILITFLISRRDVKQLKKTSEDIKVVSDNTHQIVNSNNTALLVDAARQARLIANLLTRLASHDPLDLSARKDADEAGIVADIKEEKANKSVAAADAVEGRKDTQGV